jgi:hypothetical protein
MPHWYIETWSPQDGIAFAQKCESSERENPSLTVALGPPAWQPFEVSAASARRAERGPCQVHLLDENGGEIAFKTLAELVAVVRQAYIGAGGGPGEEELVPAPLSPDDDPDLQGELDALSKKWDSLRAKFMGPDDKAAADNFATEVEREAGPILKRLFERFAIRYHALLSPGQRMRQDDLDFDRAVARMGYFGFPRMFGDDSQVVRMLHDLLFRMPPPLAFNLGARSARRLSLGDCLTYAMSSRHHIAQLSAANFAVLLFAACAVVAGTGIHDERGGAARTWSSQIRIEAARWLYREQPRVDPTTPAGGALRQQLA